MVEDHPTERAEIMLRIASEIEPSTTRQRTDRGLFNQPTVPANVTPDMRVARQEIFRPVITSLKYRDADKAISLAINTELGLHGIVFGGGPYKAQ